MSGMGLGGSGGFALVVLHGLTLAALLSAFGSLFFLGFVAPGTAEREAGRVCAAVSRKSLLFAIVLGLAWLFAESKFIAGATGFGQTVAAVPVVVRVTTFGQVCVAQCLALVAAFFVLERERSRPDRGRDGRRAGVAAVLAGLATALEAWHLHGAAMHAGLSPILISELFHVLAAGAWLGGLLPLALFVRAVPPEMGAVAARRFSAAATVCVVVLAVTALWQGCRLVGSVSALFGTVYGWVALVKLGLFAALLIFAARHRLELTPRLSGAEPMVARVVAKERLARSIFAEMVLGLAIVLVAALIASLAPPADMRMATGRAHAAHSVVPG